MTKSPSTLPAGRLVEAFLCSGGGETPLHHSYTSHPILHHSILSVPVEGTNFIISSRRQPLQFALKNSGFKIGATQLGPIRLKIPLQKLLPEKTASTKLIRSDEDVNLMEKVSTGKIPLEYEPHNLSVRDDGIVTRIRGYTGRDYQIESVENFMRNKEQLIIAQTGSGKTLIGALCAASLSVKLGRAANVLVIAPQKHLLEHWQSEEIPSLETRTIHMALKQAKVHDGYDLVIMDECHQFESESWGQIHEKSSTIRHVLGLTATPQRASIRFNHIFDVDSNYPNAVPVAEPEFIFHEIKAEGEYSGTYVNPEGEEVPVADAIKEWGMRRIVMSEVAAKQTTVWQEDIGNMKTLHSAIMARNAGFKAADRVEKACEIIEGLPEGSHTLVMSATIEEADYLSSLFMMHAVHSKQLDDVNSALVSAFKEGESNILFSVGMLRQGFDCPRANTMVIVSTTRSERSLRQTVGRVLRPHPDKGVATVHVIILPDVCVGVDSEGLPKYKNVEIGMKDTLHRVFNPTDPAYEHHFDSMKVKWKWEAGVRYRVHYFGTTPVVYRVDNLMVLKPEPYFNALGNEAYDNGFSNGLIVLHQDNWVGRRRDTERRVWYNLLGEDEGIPETVTVEELGVTLSEWFNLSAEERSDYQ